VRVRVRVRARARTCIIVASCYLPGELIRIILSMTPTSQTIVRTRLLFTKIDIWMVSTYRLSTLSVLLCKEPCQKQKFFVNTLTHTHTHSHTHTHTRPHTHTHTRCRCASRHVAGGHAPPALPRAHAGTRVRVQMHVHALAYVFRGRVFV